MFFKKYVHVLLRKELTTTETSTFMILKTRDLLISLTCESGPMWVT